MEGVSPSHQTPPGLCATFRSAHQTLPCLDHCNAFYMGLPLKNNEKLQLIQNTAAQIFMATLSFHPSGTSILQAALDNH